MKIKDRPYLSHEKFRKLFNRLEELGFEEERPDRMMQKIKESGSVPFLKKKFEGREKVFVRPHGILENFFCTSFVDAIQDINEEDYFWQGINTKGSRRTFFWFPLLRTRNSIENAIADAEMLIEVAEKMPYCPECGQQLYLDYYPEVMHLMRYVCGNAKFIHRYQNKVPYAVFDNPDLSDKNSLRIFNRYQQFYKYEYELYLKDPEKKHQSARALRARRKQEARLEKNKKTNQYGDIKAFADDVYEDGPHNDGSYGD